MELSSMRWHWPPYGVAVSVQRWSMRSDKDDDLENVVVKGGRWREFELTADLQWRLALGPVSTFKVFEGFARIGRWWLRRKDRTEYRFSSYVFVLCFMNGKLKAVASGGCFLAFVLHSKRKREWKRENERARDKRVRRDELIVVVFVCCALNDE